MTLVLKKSNTKFLQEYKNIFKFACYILVTLNKACWRPNLDDDFQIVENTSSLADNHSLSGYMNRIIVQLFHHFSSSPLSTFHLSQSATYIGVYFLEMLT